jgi:hypothetical protein
VRPVRAARGEFAVRERRMAEVERNGYPHIEPLEISDDEILEQIRREVETYLDMTFDEFLDAYSNDALPDDLITNELAMLLDFVEYSHGVRR